MREFIVPSSFHFFYKHTFCPTNQPFVQEVKKIHYVISDSVARQLRSDVPIVSILSEGIDSSSIVAVVKEIIHV
ncbi:asparagine synthase C-terminal domain-containing protein [Metabacillus halosaccharovorans]|uniref:Asparagine synthase C-terminal domain-containing protein n=1 Tax=Metabacillus halosaccharovorans TaxID=930124 RepID=A0ABT3DBD3_9BACI|nr:asparagine synthase C-terminal domain-containing protein [Metabacillus halosaccharovorans]MCV9884368.1 asparagine synthase C-terminal domain-containing protein [Metabacillus halosaccharovorans]